MEKDDHNISDKNQKVMNIWESLLDEYFYIKVLRPDTEKTYRKIVRLFLCYCQQHETGLPLPDDVTDRHVLRWRKYELFVKGIQEITWNTKMRHMQALYNFWMKRKILSVKENPFTGTRVEPGEKRKKFYTLSQLRKIYYVLEQFQQQEYILSPDKRRFSDCALYPTRFWLAVLETLRLSAIRFNQLVNLRICDLAFEDHAITMRSQSSKNHREYNIPFLQPLREILRTLVDEMFEKKAKSTDILFDVHRLSPHISGEKTTVMQTVRSFFHRLSKECGFHVSPHRFRHTFATILMKNPDRNVQIVQRMLGHRSLVSTLEYIGMDVTVTTELLEKELADYLKMGLGGERQRSVNHGNKLTSTS